MFNEEYNNLSNSAVKKVDLLKTNFLGYFILSMLAGIFVGVGVLFAFSIGGQVSGTEFSSLSKILMGSVFGIALALVVMAGAELFTGNNLSIVAGVLNKKVSFKDMIITLIVCYIGNWAGGILLALLFQMTGLNSGNVGDFILQSANIKMSLGVFEIIGRGILCNMLVCLGVWCCNKLKSETAKLIMIFWCLFAFITTGFEHSVANMTLLTVSLFNGASIAGYFYNILLATLGNLIGGIFLVAIPYYISSRTK